MRCFIIAGLLLIASCVSNPSGIGSTVTTCCPDSGYETFELETYQIPSFLESLIASNLRTVLAIKGLQPVSGNGDLAVRIIYEQENLAIAARYDDFDERISEGGDVRFVARITVEMKDRKTNEIVYKGSIQRIHEVSPGEYMHTGRASVAMFDAFSAMLADLP